MIKIEIDAATGAEARLELLNLLGLAPAISDENSELNFLKQQNKEALEILEENEYGSLDDKERAISIAQEKIKAKRRTKAEIEAEKKVNDNEPDTSKAPEGPVDAEQAEKDKEALDTGAALADTVTEFPTLQDLQRVCAILVRAGYKQQGIDFIKNVGSADTSKDVAEDKRQACIDAMTKFAEENKISL